MTGNEPLLLYTGEQPLYKLFCWRESDDESFFLAVRGEKAGIELTRATRSVAGSERIKIAGEQLNKNGGILISASRNKEGGYDLALLTSESKQAKARGYVPPARCQVFDPGGTVESRSLGGSGVHLNAFQYALIPVDENAQMQLQSTVRELDNLPGDLRAEMLQTLTGHAIAQAAVRDLEDKPARAKTGPAWPWAALALIIGLAAGCAGYAVYLKRYSASGRAQAETARHHAGIDSALANFDAAMKQSAVPSFKTLYDFHLSPLSATPVQGVAASALESWMLLKVALLRHNPPADSGSGVLPSTVNWSESSNQEAKADFAKKESLSVPDRNAVLAATCLDGEPSAAFATAEDCRSVDWNAAAADLKVLTEYVKNSPASPPAAGVAPSQVQPQPARSGR